jgi:hypothetical protein
MIEDKAKEFVLPPADEMPILEPRLEEKPVLAGYLIKGARRILNIGTEANPETMASAIREASRRLSAARFLLEDHPDRQTGTKSTVPEWPQHLKPENQAAFHEWVRAFFRRVFQLGKQPDTPFIPLDAPIVKGLAIFAAKSGETSFYGAWTAASGVFIGWMRIQPQISGIDSDYAVGEILGRTIFEAVSIDLSGHAAVDRFVRLLEEAAWDLGLAGG